MTNFIYNMQDELFDLNMILPVGKFSPIKKLVDHIEAQGKQLRELNKAIEKKNATIGGYEHEIETLRESNANLGKKISELYNGIRDTDDLSWKQKYDALRHGSEQAIAALQKKCQEYKHSEDDATISTIETFSEANKKLEESNKRLMERRGELMRQCDELFMENEELKEEYEALEKNRNELLAERNALRNENNELKEEVKRIEKLEEENKKLKRSNLDMGDTIGLYVEEFKKLKAENNNFLESKKFIEKRCRDAEKALEMEKQISNNKIRELDEYMTKYNNLEHNYNEEVRMKEQFKTICFRHERTIESQNSTIKYLKGQVSDYVRVNNVLRRKLESIDALTDKIDDVILSEE